VTLRTVYASLRRRLRYRRCLAASSGVIVLRYHSVGEPADVRAYLDPGLSLAPQSFRAQIRALARRFEVLAPGDVPRRAARPAVRGRAVVLTFDDGYRDNHDVALPILREEGVPAAFYVTTGPLSSGRGLWISELFRLVSRLPAGPLASPGAGPEMVVPAEGGAARTPLRRALTRRLSPLPAPAREAFLDALAERAGVGRGEGLARSFMTPDHLRALRRAGMTVGAHTRSHPHLNELPREHHSGEVHGSREDLEAILGEPVPHFAYPNPGGQRGVDPAARASVAEAGFETAMTSVTAPIDASTDPLAIPRIGVYPGAQATLLFRVLDALPEAG
jgi:peptidoglycan/xylan/chitin deacetylase (PgdA/CDA1 family)